MDTVFLYYLRLFISILKKHSQNLVELIVAWGIIAKSWDNLCAHLLLLTIYVYHNFITFIDQLMFLMLPFSILDVERNFTPSLPRAREGSGVKPSTVQAHAPPGAEKPGFMRSTPKEQDYLIHHRPKKQRRPQDCAVMVAWLENLDDMAKFPIRVLSQALHNMMYPLASSFTPGVSSSNAHKYYLGRPYLPVIFISSLPSGLYRIHTWIPALRYVWMHFNQIWYSCVDVVGYDITIFSTYIIKLLLFPCNLRLV